MPKIVVCFPQGRHKALTMSYDDGTLSDKRLVELFNRTGIKGTFHINSGLFGEGNRLTEEEASTLYEGHEVSAHTLTHPTIARSPREQIVYEITEDRKRLEQMVGYTVRGMSYPNGSYNQEIKEMLPYLGIEYARVVQTTGGFGMPDDWHEWKATCHHNKQLMEHAKTFVELHKSQYLYLMYVWGHSYEFDHDNNWELIEQFCEYVGGRDNIWFATNLEITDYMNAYKQLKFSAACDFVYNCTALSIWLNVDGDSVEVPSGSTVKLV